MPKFPTAVICGVEPKELSKDELRLSLEILRSHNRVIDKHGRRSKLSLEKFREEFLSGRVKVELTAKDRSAINALSDDIKCNVLAHHVRLAKKIAISLCRKFYVTDYDSKEQIFSEAGYALMKSLYAYTNPDVAFSTFAHWVVMNTLNDYFRSNHNGLSPVSKKGLELTNRIHKHQESSGEFISFSQAVADLGLSDAEINDAMQASRECVPVSTIGQTGGPVDEGDDAIHVDFAVVYDDPMTEPLLVEAFETAPLNELERAVMDAALEPWHGWMIDLGRQFPHDNGEHRSRQHIWMLLKRVQKKVQAHYEAIKSRSLKAIA